MISTDMLVSQLSNITKSSTFLSIKDYTNKNLETSDYQILFNIKYSTLLKNSIEQLNALTFSTNLENLAKQEILTSLNKSLTNKKIDDVPSHFTTIKDQDGNIVKGITLCNKTNNLHISGRFLNKHVKKQGSYPEVNSSEFTLVKKGILKNLPCSKYRSFILNDKNCHSISVDKITIIL